MTHITINDLAPVEALEHAELARITGGRAPDAKGASGELQNQPFTPHSIQGRQPSLVVPWGPAQFEDCCN